MRLACIRNEGSKRPDEIPMPRGEGATELPSASRHGERRQATMPFDPPTMDWLTRNDLFTTAFRYLEQGELDEADRAFAEFLERTKDDPSRSFRATAMLARNAIASRQSAPAKYLHTIAKASFALPRERWCPTTVARRCFPREKLTCGRVCPSVSSALFGRATPAGQDQTWDAEMKRVHGRERWSAERRSARRLNPAIARGAPRHPGRRAES